jgi:CDP-diacylglycerol---glycerol-3-phosphate 3-phosphatidyltransferase
MSLAMALTVGRIALAPVFFLLFELASTGSPVLLFGVWAVLALMEISDLLDGFVARRFHQESELGKILDPCADSISRLTYFVALAGSGILPLWVLLVLVYRDIGVAYIRVMLSRDKYLMPARLSGKLKAWVYAVAGIAGLVWFTMDRTGSELSGSAALHIVLTTLFVLAAAVAAWSLADYFAFFVRNSRKGS